MRAWAELSRDDPLLPSGFTLSRLNDRGVSFAKIADAIEQYL